MNKFISTLILLLIMISSGFIEAKPSLEKDLGLDSVWALRVDDGQLRPIKVTAGGWNSDQQCPQIPSATVKNHVIYERQITIPQEAAGNVVKVEFGGCNYGAEVFLDDHKVTENYLPMVPFEADLTNIVEPGKTYLLRVKAYTRFHYGELGKPTRVPAGFDFNKDMVKLPAPFTGKFNGCTKFAYGLTGYVKLVIYPPVYISNVFVRASVKNKSLAYDVWVTNGSKEDRTVNLTAALASWNKRSYQYPTLPKRTITVKAGQTQKVTVQNVAWNLGTDSYWWPNIPFCENYSATLHWLKLSLTEKDNVLHKKCQRFGFVEYCEGPYYYTVNGVRFTSLSDSNSYGQIGEYDCWSETPCFLPPDGTYKGCPETWKRYQRIGFNTMRLSTSVPTRYMLETADEAGYMLIIEGGSWGNNTSIFDKDTFSAQLQGTMRVCRNHPSVARYCMANESIHGDGGEWRWLVDAALEADPTRPYVYEVNPDVGAGRIEGMKAGHAYKMLHYDPIVQGGDFIRGMGECCWDTLGLEPFGSYARRLRLNDWTHLAPWSWINYWPNFLEGMNHERHPWKYNNHPDRKDGIDGWDSPPVTYVQRSLDPFLVLDHHNISPDFSPFKQELNNDNTIYLPGEKIERKIEVFNGGLSGNKMQLRWTARWDSPDGPVIMGDTMGPFTVEPGFHTTQTISFTAPLLQPNQSSRKFYLLLESIKDGKVVFREEGLWYTISHDKSDMWCTFDDYAQAVEYSSGWGTWISSPTYLATQHYTQTPGSTATFTFTGTKAVVYGLKRFDMGIAEVYVDELVADKIDLYSEQLQYAKLYETDDLPVGEHRLKVKVTEQKNKASAACWVVIDAFQKK